MLQTKRYKSAPITEAVIEIRVQPTKQVDEAAQATLVKALQADFPKHAPMQFLEMGIAQRAGQALQQRFSQSVIGVRLSKADDSRVLQIRGDGFAYSHMAPYTDWLTFKNEARPLWDRFRELCRNAKLARCALRYINRIDIPGLKVEPKDYFRLYPQIPDELPQQDLLGMTCSLQMPQEDLRCMANIGQVVSEPIKPGHISVILDVDIFRLQIEDWDDEAAWTFLEQLRVRKNEIFEACITDRTRELIDR